MVVFGKLTYSSDISIVTGTTPVRVDTEQPNEHWILLKGRERLSKQEVLTLYKRNKNL